MKLKRVCIYCRDVQRMTGKSERASYRLLKRIKQVLGKEDHQFIVVEEFAKFTGISQEIIESYLFD